MFLYDSKVGYHIVFTGLAHSVVPLVLVRLEFWFFLCINLAIFVAYRYGYFQDADESSSLEYLDWNAVKVVSAFTAFFQVFYTNSCFIRYHELHELCRHMVGNMYETAFELSIHLQTEDLKPYCRLAVRWLMGSVLLFFYEQDDCIEEEEWQEILGQSLLEAHERKYLETFSTKQRSLIMLRWSAEASNIGLQKSKAPTNLLKDVTSKLLKNRFLQQQFWDTRNLPMPFQYYHFLKSILCMNLLLWGYRMGLTKSLFGPAIYIFAAIISMGMAELAEELSDPFGPAELDFPVKQWLSEAVENTILLVECPSIAENPVLKHSASSQGPLSLGHRSFDRISMNMNMAQRTDFSLCPSCHGDAEEGRESEEDVVYAHYTQMKPSM